MSYTPINTDSYTNAFAGAIAGMAVSGWIVDPTSGNYAHVAAIAGAFAEAFDTVWNDATALNSLQTQAIQSVCQEQFAGHAPGSLDNTRFTSAANWAVPAAACAALVLEGDAYVASQGITPTTPGGGAFAPIQNERFFDPTFAGTSNGSIGTPWALMASFYAEIVDDNGWKLNLPGGAAFTPDAGIPDLNQSAAVVFEGLGRNATFMENLSIANQSGSGSFQFQDMTLDGTTPIAGGNIDLFFDGCVINHITVGGTLTGTTHLTNCDVIAGLSLGSFGPSLVAYGPGTLGGPISAEFAEFHEVNFGSDAALDFGSHVIRFTSCFFPAGVTISNSNNPIIEMDPSTFYWFQANAVAFAGTIRLTPSTPIIGHVSKAAAGNVGGGASTTIDMGNPVGSRLAEMGSTIVGAWGGAGPGNIAFQLESLTVDGSTGHIMALIGNTSSGTLTLANPLVINVVYSPREQA